MFKPGDMVTHFGNQATVVAVDGDAAWLRLVGPDWKPAGVLWPRGSDLLVPVGDLTALPTQTFVVKVFGLDYEGRPLRASTVQGFLESAFFLSVRAGLRFEVEES